MTSLRPNLPACFRCHCASHPDLTTSLNLLLCASRCCPQTGSTVYYATYTSTACTGTPTTNPLPKQSCGCSVKSTSPCQAYSSGYYYLPSVPSISGQVQTTTVYSGSTCGSGTAMYVTVQPTSYCYSQSCTASNGVYYSSTCAGASAGTVTSGYALASSTYATADTTCSTPLSSFYYALGACVSIGTNSAIKFTADTAGKIYYASFSSSTCSSTTATANYQYPSSVCVAGTSGRTTSFTYALTIPQYSGQTQLLTYYTGSDCTSANALYVTVSPNVASCSPVACQSGSSGSSAYSYQYACQGATTTITALSPTPAPSADGTQTTAVYVVNIVLAGISPDEFNGNPMLQSSMKNSIASSLPGVSPSAITLVAQASSLSTRRGLLATKAATIVSSINAPTSAIQSGAQVVTALSSDQAQANLQSAMVSRAEQSRAEQSSVEQRRAAARQAWRRESESQSVRVLFGVLLAAFCVVSECPSI